MLTNTFIRIEANIQQQLLNKTGEDFVLSVNTEIDLAKGITGIYGGSGQGKSTFLKILAGLMPSDSSVVSWCDDKANKFNSNKAEQVPAVYQGQDITLFEHMTVAQNLAFVQQHSTWSRTTSFTVEQVVDWCGIATLLKQQSISLSGGEKQRVGLARSLLSGKPVILLDEPFSALDWSTRTHMLTLIKKLNKEYNLGFVLVSHSLQELALSCDYLLEFNQGKLVKTGPIASVIQALSIHSSEPIFSRLTLNSPSYLPEYHLTKWQLAGGSQQSVYCKQPVDGKDVFEQQIVTLQADKVSLSRQVIEQSSMLNQVTGTITHMQEFEHLVLVSIDIDGQPLLSLISQLSRQKLALEQGQSIVAMFKAV